MLLRRKLLPVKRKHLAGLFLLTAIATICVAFGMTGSNGFDVARREILLREIGHETLLQSGDSTSRVLPVKKVAEDEYQISFENAFTFQPEALVKTTRRVLATDALASDYVVNVLNSGVERVAYGFAISKNRKDDVVPCNGRTQPTGRYLISIKFSPTGIVAAKNKYLLASLIILAFIGIIFFSSVKWRKSLQEKQPTGPEYQPAGFEDRSTNVFTLGSMSFNAETRTLMMNGKTSDLTRTETRIFGIFAASPNEVIARSRLQKEIWEDEGVLVGRSLDMFISKLRKKLGPDPNIKIVVIRGKGYRLETGAYKDLPPDR